MMLTIIGLMSGTSADGIDVALVSTDGHSKCRLLDSHFASYRDSTRAEILLARDDPAHYLADANRLAALTAAITEDHLSSFIHFLNNPDYQIDLIGFHGQTIYHNPQIGRTVQLGDGMALARQTGIDVIYDFRRADIEAGGEGAPLAPVYHQFLVTSAGIPQPAVIINIGGVANLTFIDDANDVIAGYDIGPGNGLMDTLMQRRTGLPYDEGGALAGAGSADEGLVASALENPFFASSGPKSLDWAAFTGLLDAPALARLPLADSLATLCQFSARAITQAVAALERPPVAVLVTGGGQHNKTLLAAIRASLPTGVSLLNAADYGLQSDMIEAELIAFLAARHHHQLPGSFPTTTGVASPQIAGIRTSG